MNKTLLTDLYQLTMAQGYWKEDRHNDEAVFHLFFRKNPFGGGYAVACGLEQVIELLDNFHFDESDLRYLRSFTGNDGKVLFEEGFLQYLKNLHFTCSVHAMQEGELAFPHEPLLRIQGPLLQCQVLETPLLTMLNFQTLIATKAARICYAAQGDPVLEFGLRRAQGIDGGISASRAAYIGGCVATSNVLAGKRYGIPVKGTHAHSWVMGFESELTAFRAYARAMPNNSVFLVDTYDTIEGVKHAIQVGEELRASGHAMAGIRLDSGDLTALSIEARKLLDDAGFPKTSIVASNDLDEYRITQLKAEGALIDTWGVGTRLVTAYDQPALGGVYKLSAIRRKGEDWQYRLKLSEDPVKVSNPGVLQVQRFIKDDYIFADVMINEHGNTHVNEFHSFEGHKIQVQHLPYRELLIPIYLEGKRIYKSPTIVESRKRAKHGLEKLPPTILALQPTVNYQVGLENELKDLKSTLIHMASGS